MSKDWLQVKVRVHDTLALTEKAGLFLFADQEVWLPLKFIKIKRSFILMPFWLAKKNDLNFKTYIHKPEKIEPGFNQEAINELRFDPNKGV